MKPAIFLRRVWGQNEGWVDLPTKVNGHWIPFEVEYPSDNGVIESRIDTSLRDKENLYFSVILFASQGRHHGDALGFDWLWADLDHISPADCIRVGLAPTVAWESSPGRFQALWKLRRRVAPTALERLNRLLTYALDADKGGWDLTQVLRIPGTRNYKYPGAPPVKLLFDSGPTYDPRELYTKLKKIVPPEDRPTSTAAYEADTDWELPARARALLRTPLDQVVVGERSDRLWELECLLVESLIPEEVIFDLIWPCAWNKHREVNTGEASLRREIKRAIAYVLKKAGVEPTAPEASAAPAAPAPTKSDLGLTRYAAFMSQPFPQPRWLVEGVWTSESHGVIGGEPKTSKSYISLALALSVASGKDFMGKYPVHTTGPVIVVQEENSDWVMQDRLRKLAAYYGLIPKRDVKVRRYDDPGLIGMSGAVLQIKFPTGPKAVGSDLELYLLNHSGFDMSVEENREALENDIDHLRPALVIFDPLYLMLGGANENSGHELRPFLQWLLALRYEYRCAIAVVHHFSKQHANTAGRRPGQRLMGNATLHGWVESSLYMERIESEDLDPHCLTVRMEPEFRNMPPREAMDMWLRPGEPGALDFEARVEGWSPEVDLALRVTEAGDDGVLLSELCKMFDSTKSAMRRKVKTAGFRVVKRGRFTYVVADTTESAP